MPSPEVHINQMKKMKNEKIHDPQKGDLVYIIDPDYPEPIMMGIGLVMGETRIYKESLNINTSSTPVWWEGRIHYFDKPYWMLEVLNRA